MPKRLSKILFLIAAVIIGSFIFTKVKVPLSGGAKNLTALLPIEETVADNLGVYFWAGSAGGSQSEIIQTGAGLLEDIGAANIRITMSARSDQDYKGGGCIANFSLKNLAARADFNAIFSNPNFKTIMITAIDGVSFPDCFTKNYLNPNFYTAGNIQRIQQEYADFARYLGAFSGKTFILSNWEGDNEIYCGAAYGATSASCPNYRQALESFKKWMSARATGIKASGAGNVFSAVEFNIVRDLKNRGLPSVLYDVIPVVDADYFSYSSYESINALYSGDDGGQLKADAATIRNVLSSAGKNPNNLIIGEYGFDQGNREEIKSKLTIVTQAISELGIKYAFVWNLLDAGGQFGLYDSTPALTPAGEYFCDIFEGSACGPLLTLTNITEAGRNPRFWTIDSWRLELKNAQPEAALKICAEQNGNLLGCTPVEELGFGASVTTDANGAWFLENSWAGFDDTSLVGTWKEWMEIGDIKSTAIRFKISSPDLSAPANKLLIPDSERNLEAKITALQSGEKFEEKPQAEGGTAPYNWEVIRGELPEGWTLSLDGTLSGEAGEASGANFIKPALALNPTGFGARVTDSSRPARRAAADIELGIAPARAAADSGGRGGLVHCGRLSDDPTTTDRDERRICTVCDTLVLASRVINFVLFTLVPAIAVLFYLIAGFLILLGGANPGWVTTGKTIFKNTTWGLIIIFGAWMIANSVLKSIAGNYFDKQPDPWYRVVCTEPAPQPPPSTQRYNCSSENVCVAIAGGQYNNPTCDDGTGSRCPPAAGDACDRPQTLAQQHNNARYPKGNAPELDQLINCVMSNRDIATFIDQNQIFTFERDREICNYTRADGHCTSACAHRRNSCHYGGASGTTGAQGVDFNARGVSERALFDMLRALEGQCNFGAILFETDHTHISTRSCTGN